MQVVASSVVKAYELSMESERESVMRSYVDSVIDLYMMVEHPDVWKSVESKRRAAESDEMTLDELSADTMDEMLEKMRRAAGML